MSLKTTRIYVEKGTQPATSPWLVGLHWPWLICQFFTASSPSGFTHLSTNENAHGRSPPAMLTAKTDVLKKYKNVSKPS